jgi:hypothetical protein
VNIQIKETKNKNETPFAKKEKRKVFCTFTIHLKEECPYL